MIKHRGSMMIELLLTTGILSFSLAGIFAFCNSLINISRQTTLLVEEIITYPVVYSCYSPLITGSIDHSDSTDKGLQLYQVNHQPASILPKSDNVCHASLKANNTNAMLIYCFGDNKDKK